MRVAATPAGIPHTILELRITRASPRADTHAPGRCGTAPGAWPVLCALHFPRTRVGQCIVLRVWSAVSYGLGALAELCTSVAASPTVPATCGLGPLEWTSERPVGRPYGALAGSTLCRPALIKSVWSVWLLGDPVCRGYSVRWGARGTEAQWCKGPVGLLGALGHWGVQNL